METKEKEQSRITKIIGWAWDRLFGKRTIIGPDPRYAIYSIFAGALLILASIIFGGIFHGTDVTNHPFRYTFFAFCYHASRDFGIGFFSAGVIALILEMRNFIAYTEQAMLNVFQNNTLLENAFWKIVNSIPYLDTLDGGVIKTMKHNMRDADLKRKGFKIEDHSLVSLTKFEDKITESLYGPYYERYRVEVICKEVKLNEAKGLEHLFDKNPDVILVQKTITTVIDLINPSSNPVSHDLTFQVTLKCADFMTEADRDKVCRFDDFFYYADDKMKTPLENVVYKRDPSYKSSKGPIPESYNTRFNASSTDGKSLEIPYESKLHIEFIETRYTNLRDTVYRRRLLKPSMFTQLSYEYIKHPTSNYKVSLTGDCMATLWQGNDKIKISDDKGDGRFNIAIDTWMLAGNGIFVMHNFFLPETI